VEILKTPKGDTAGYGRDSNRAPNWCSFKRGCWRQ